MQGSQPWRIWRASSSILFSNPHTIDSFASLEHGADKSHELVHHSTTFSLAPPLSHLSGRCPFSTSEIIPRSLTYTIFRSGSSVYFRTYEVPRLYELPSTLDCTVLLGALRTLICKFITPGHPGRLLKSQHSSLRLPVPS